MQAFEPVCRDIAAKLAHGLSAGGEIELMADFAQTFALQIQCAFMGWPVELQEPLRQWTDKKNQATLAQDRTALAAITRQFNDRIRSLLHVRREAGANAPDDITTNLLHDKVWGRPLTDEEIASILRNWTVGEVGTIAACVGILAHYLAEHAELQQRLREQPAILPAAIDEILRIHAPLIANRRAATQPVEIGGRKLNAGARISIIWASAVNDHPYGAIPGSP
jgi:cytochrome P450